MLFESELVNIFERRPQQVLTYTTRILIRMSLKPVTVGEKGVFTQRYHLTNENAEA